MPAAYFCDLVEVGRTIFGQPDLDIAAPPDWIRLFIDPPNRKACIVSRHRDLAGDGFVKLCEGATKREYFSVMRETGPTAQQRQRIASWLESNGYRVPSNVGSPSWAQVLRFICRQVDPQAEPEDVKLPGAYE